MYTNAPTPELYRVAELRRQEDLMKATEQRRFKLLTQPSSFAGQLRNRLGTVLIAIGVWMKLDPSPPSRVGEATVG